MKTASPQPPSVIAAAALLDAGEAVGVARRAEDLIRSELVRIGKSPMDWAELIERAANQAKTVLMAPEVREHLRGEPGRAPNASEIAAAVAAYMKETNG